MNANARVCRGLQVRMSGYSSGNAETPEYGGVGSGGTAVSCDSRMSLKCCKGGFITYTSMPATTC